MVILGPVRVMGAGPGVVLIMCVVEVRVYLCIVKYSSLYLNSIQYYCMLFRYKLLYYA